MNKPETRKLLTGRFEESARESPSCHTSERVMFTPNRVNGRINPIVPQSCRVGAEWRTKRTLAGENTPKTPAELPKNVPLRVTELRMLLIRNRIFDTASGLLAPSRKPHAPPRARPIVVRTCGQYKDNKMVR